jgi:hypothetical protein
VRNSILLFDRSTTHAPVYSRFDVFQLHPPLVAVKTIAPGFISFKQNSYSSKLLIPFTLTSSFVSIFNLLPVNTSFVVASPQTPPHSIVSPENFAGTVIVIVLLIALPLPTTYPP